MTDLKQIGAPDAKSDARRRVVAFGEFSFDTDSRILWRGAETVQLAPKACELLGVLIENAPQIVSKDDLMNRVWADAFVEEANLTHHISALRKTLGEGLDGKKFIETLPRKGYRFVAEIREDESDTSEFNLDEEAKNLAGKEIFESKENQSRISEDESPSIFDDQPAVNLVKNESLPVTIPDESKPVELVGGESPTPVTDLVKSKRSRLSPPFRLAVIGALVIGAAIGGVALYKFFARRAPMVFRTGATRRLTTTGRVALPRVSPDGRYVLYVKRETGGRSLWIRQTANDSDVQIAPVVPTDDTFGGATFTPDGNQVYFSIKRKGEPYSVLYRIPVFGGAQTKVLENLLAAITFSPDGKQFAFLRSFPEQNEYALMLADADGGNQRRLVARQRPTHFNGHSAWSPDGKTILCPAVNTTGGFHYELLAVNVADGAITPVPSKLWQNIDNMAWLPDGSGVLLVAQNEKSLANQIWQVSIPGGEAAQITNDTSLYGSVGLTADGRFLVANKIEQDAHLWLVSAENQTDARQLTLGEDNYDGVFGIGWLPSGREIVYESKADGRNNLWQIAPDGKNSRRLTEDLGAGLDVSLDGRFIVYQSQENESLGLWRYDTTDATTKRLTSGVDITPAFAPDGKNVFFSRLSNTTNLWRVSIDGGEAQQLTDEFRTTTSPAVSPDGKYLAFAYARAEKTPDAPQTGLAIMPIGGGQPIKSFAVSFPFGSLYEQVTLQWTPDGAGINYLILRDGVSNIWRQPAAGGEPVQITNFTDGRVFNFAFSPDGKQIALSRGKVVSDVVMIENAR